MSYMAEVTKYFTCLMAEVPEQFNLLGGSSIRAVYISRTDVVDALYSDRLHPNHLVYPSGAGIENGKR